MTEREARLWLLAFIVLMSVAVVLALVSWRSIRSVPWQLEAPTVGLVLVVSLFGLYAILRWREMLRVRELARDLSGQSETPAAGQVERLFEVVQQSQRGYRDLIDTFDDVLLSLTPRGEILTANRSFVDLLRRPFGEVVGHGVGEFLELAGNSDATILQGEMAFLKERRHWAGVLPIRLKHESTTRAFECSAHILVRKGKKEAICVLARDITKEHEIESRLQREQEFGRRLVESFPDLVVALDREGRYTFLGPRCKELLGFSPEELIGSLVSDHIEPHSRKEMQRLWTALVSGQRANGSIEFQIRRGDGELRLLRATASPLMDGAGLIVGVIAAARDITDSKRMEQQLIQNERLAAMGQMIAGVAHELNNPLTAVLGVTELLRDSTLDDSTRRQLDIAHRQARRAAQIVQSLLAFSRPPQPRKICVNLGELIQRSLQLHEHSLRNNSVAVDFSSAPNIPMVLGDTSQLTQVFLNLIANAEQAIHEVRDYGTLRIRVSVAGDRVVATFEDDGAGIRREIVSKIFDPFFTTKRPGRGTGLGLSICLAILREHSGEIEAQPLAEGGSRFTVSLPIARGTALFLADSADGTTTGDSKLSQEPETAYSILVVDDEESIREMIREGLSARGFSVASAAAVQEALLLMERQSFDAVLCDLNLRSGAGADSSGLGLYAAVRNATWETKNRPIFLFMSGQLVSPAVTQQLSTAGARILQKPFRISDLMTLLAEMLDTRSVGASRLSQVR